jgi:hypothetical protein
MLVTVTLIRLSDNCLHSRIRELALHRPHGPGSIATVQGNNVHSSQRERDFTFCCTSHSWQKA